MTPIDPRRLMAEVDMTFDPVAYKESVKAEWERAAPGWHRWGPTIEDWLAEATESMLDEAQVIVGSRVIDIAAGDGGQSISAARRVGPTGAVLATDIVPEFVRLAEAAAARLGLTQLSSAMMDAESLTIEDARYDAAVSRLGLMYLPDLPKALMEIRRVLRPGGRVSAVVFTTPAKTPFFSIPVRLIRERRGLPAPAPGRPGPFALGSDGVLAGHVEAAGFRHVREDIIDAPLRLSSAAECVRWRREASGTMQQMLSGLDEHDQEAIWQDIEDELRRFETPEGFVSPCELLVVSGSK